MTDAHKSNTSSGPDPGRAPRRIDTPSLEAAIVRLEGNDRRETNDALIVEEPLAIWINGEQYMTLMRTPGEDRALTFGFLLTEGIIRGVEEVSIFTECRDIDPDSGNTVRITLAAEATGRLTPRARAFEARTSCSLCGEKEIEELCSSVVPIEPGEPVDKKIIFDAMRQLEDHQPLFRSTGSAHGVALFSADGAFLASGEDAGRHNALDKAVGIALLRGLPIHDAIAATSGRASFEIALKAARAGIAVLASVSGATSLAAAVARRSGLCLIGFARGKRMNIYAHASRIAD